MKKQKKHNGKRGSIILAVILTVAVCYFFISFFNLRSEVSQKESEASKLQLQATLVEEENSEMSELLDDGNVDEFVERRAREEDLGYVMPGERVYYDLEIMG